MTTTKVIIISVISAIVITAIGVVAFAGLQMKSSGSPTLGSQIQNDTFWFTNGIKIGAQGIYTITATGIGNLNVLVTNDFIDYSAGYGTPITTSTTLSAGQYCQGTVQYFNSLTALATETFPTANAAYAACGFPAFGAQSPEEIINDSANTVNVVAGSGMVFRCETQGVGTTTVVGGCTASQISIPGSSTVNVYGYWTTSSTAYLEWGNMYH